ncbi:MAG: hypothetical protein PUB37_02920 [Firmicutes bacterium]|nr:hypothetical protein [Bacillota bacterium]
MSTCPACKKNKLIRVGDTYQCKDPECGLIRQIKTPKAQKWLLKIADNEKAYWRRVFFDDLPTFVAHEYRRLWLMARRPNVFCMVYQLKDVCEVMLKFPVLCAAAYLRDEEIDGKLIEKAPSIGDWQSLCNFIIGKRGDQYRYDLPKCLRKILEGINEVFVNNNVSNYRNDYLGHGAMGFEDNQEYRDFGENLIVEISKHLGKVLSYYEQLSVTVGGVEFKGWRVPKNIDGKAEPVLHIKDREISLSPYIVNTENYGVLFFDNYSYGKNNQTAQGLNYMTGGGRKRFVAPYYCELYSRRFGNVIKKVDENAPVDGDTMLKNSKSASRRRTGSRISMKRCFSNVSLTSGMWTCSRRS